MALGSLELQLQDRMQALHQHWHLHPAGHDLLIEMPLVLKLSHGTGDCLHAVFFFLCTENKFQVVRKCLNILLWFSVSSDNRQHIGQGSAVTAETFFYKTPLDCLMG